MECSKIREYLFDYMNGLLKPEQERAVKLHLASCKECMEEYAFFRKYKKEMRSMKQHKAPADFLQNVHARIEQESTLKRVIKGLFFPLRIKLPLELAGAVAALFFVIWILPHGMEVDRAMDPAMDTQQSAGESAKVERLTLEKPKIAAIAQPRAKKFDMGAGVKSQIKASIEKNEIVELVLIVKAETETPAPAVDSYSMKSEVKDEESALTESKSVKTEKAEKRKESEPVFLKQAEAQAEAPASRSFEGAGAVQMDSAGNNISFNMDLNRMILNLKGRIIKEEYDKVSNIINSITVRIPSKNYGIFLQNLRNMGELKIPAPGIINTNQSMIQNNIRFRYSK